MRAQRFEVTVGRLNYGFVNQVTASAQSYGWDVQFWDAKGIFEKTRYFRITGPDREVDAFIRNVMAQCGAA